MSLASSSHSNIHKDVINIEALDLPFTKVDEHVSLSKSTTTSDMWAKFENWK